MDAVLDVCYLLKAAVSFLLFIKKYDSLLKTVGKIKV